MAKHTPGPWRYGEASNYCGFFIAPENCGPTLAAVERPRGSDDVINIMAFNFPGDTEANARLIAAAPDLLAACQGAMRIVSLWNGREVPEDHEHAEEMKALYMMQEAFIEAIAKAERGQA